MAKYSANFSVNCGTRLEQPLTGTNLNKIKKDIIAMAKGNIFCARNNSGAVLIYDTDTGRQVYLGMVQISRICPRDKINVNEKNIAFSCVYKIKVIYLQCKQNKSH